MNQAIDYSWIAPLAECARKWYYQSKLHLQPVHLPWPMKAGTAMHEALKSFYKVGWDLDLALAALRESYGDPAPSGKYAYLTLGHLEVVLRNYYDMYHKTTAWTDVVVIEEPISAWAIDGQYLIGGKPDLIVRDGGALKIVDHKCSTWGVTSAFEMQHRMSHQTRIYALIWNALHPNEEPILQGIVNGLNIGSGAEKAKEKFNQVKLLWSSLDLEETEDWLMALIALQLWHAEIEDEESDYPQLANFGCVRCSFREVCESTGAVRFQRLAEGWTERKPTRLLLSGADMEAE